jgi:hypothetical protein
MISVRKILYTSILNPSRLEFLLLSIALAVNLNSFYKMRELMSRLSLSKSLGKLFKKLIVFI